MNIKADFSKECEVFLIVQSGNEQTFFSHYTRPNSYSDQELHEEAFVNYEDLKQKMSLTVLSAVYVVRNQEQLDYIIDVSEGKKKLGE